MLIFPHGRQLLRIIIALTNWPVLVSANCSVKMRHYCCSDFLLQPKFLGKSWTACNVLTCRYKSFHEPNQGLIANLFKQLNKESVKRDRLDQNIADSAVNRKARLTLAGHAYWLISRLADAVADGGAARLGGVLQVGAWQAGAQASWCSLWFVCTGWTRW